MVEIKMALWGHDRKRIIKGVKVLYIVKKKAHIHTKESRAFLSFDVTRSSAPQPVPWFNHTTVIP